MTEAEGEQHAAYMYHPPRAQNLNHPKDVIKSLAHLTNLNDNIIMKFLDSVLQCLGLIRFSIYQKDTNEEYEKFIQKLNQINQNKMKFNFHWIKKQNTNNDKPLYHFTIYQEFEDKKFPNHTIKLLTTDDYDYGLICAQELCDKLNENI